MKLNKSKIYKPLSNKSNKVLRYFGLVMLFIMSAVSVYAFSSEDIHYIYDDITGVYSVSDLNITYINTTQYQPTANTATFPKPSGASDGSIGCVNTHSITALKSGMFVEFNWKMYHSGSTTRDVTINIYNSEGEYVLNKVVTTSASSTVTVIASETDYTRPIEAGENFTISICDSRRLADSSFTNQPFESTLFTAEGRLATISYQEWEKSPLQSNYSYSINEDDNILFCESCLNSNLFISSIPEGDNNINILLETSEDAKNIIMNVTIDTEEPIINNNIPSEIFNYSFNGDWVSCEDLNLAYCNISIDGFNEESGTNFSLDHNGLLSYTINAADLAGNTAQESGYVLVNPYQYFRVFDTVRSIYLTNYTLDNYSSSGEYVSFPLYDLGVGTHQLLFSKFGYEQENFSISFNNTSNLNHTFNASPVTITLQVFDENSPSTQLLFNLSVTNGTDYVQYLNQMNFSKFYNETLTGELVLTIESSGYSSRKIFTELNPYTAVSHTVYLLNDTDSTPVVFRTLNLAQTQPVEDVVLTYYKDISGIPTFIGQATTDSQGYTYFNLDPLGDYEIVISKDGYITQIINSIPGTVTYTILMETTDSRTSFLFDDFSYLITPTGSINSVPFNVTAFTFDEENLISSMRFTVTGDNISYTDVLTSSNGGTISFPILNASSLYVLNLTVVRDGTTYTFIEIVNYYDTSPTNASLSKVSEELQGAENNADRVFMMIIIYMVTVVGGALLSPTIAAVAGLIPITIFALPFVAWITPGIAAIFYVFTVLGVLYFER